MSGLPPVVIKVKDAPIITNIELIRQIVQNIDNQITTIEKEVSIASNQTKVTEINNLAEHLREIKTRAELSCALISGIVNDQPTYESINSNLIASGDTLNKMNKWINLVKELENELKAGEYDYYRIIAELLEDVNGQTKYFSAYKALPQVTIIIDKVNAITTELKRQVQWCFREIGQLLTSDPDINPNNLPNENNTISKQNLAQIYLVVDVLGKEFRNDLLERFAQLQLIPYEKAFKYKTKYCNLENLEKRYIWFRTLLKLTDDRLGSYFPKRWCVPFHLFVEFTRRTKKHLIDYLKEKNETDREQSLKDPKTYVGNILVSLQGILSFEAEMKASFDVYTRGEDDDDDEVESNDANDDSNNESTSERVKKVEYESITEAFDPYLGPYVQLEREGLDNIMSKLSQEETASIENDSTSELGSKGPYNSSSQMFEYIKKSLKRCTAFSTGVTYLSLSREYRICLHNYAESLKFRCPSPVMAKAGKPPVYQISSKEEIMLCRLICSGEYCIETIPSLESKMKEHIKDIYKNEIDFDSQIDAFNNMISYTTTVIISGIMRRIEPALELMRKINWAAIESVGDDSKYVKGIIHVLNECIPRIRIHISKSYFFNLLMKLVTTLLDNFLENIWNLKRIGMTGAGQLLLDLNGTKTYLLNMPNTRLTPDENEGYPVFKPYVSLVNTRIGKIENILKLLCTEDDKLHEVFVMLWPDGTQSDYDAIVGLKARTGILPQLGDIGSIGNKITHTPGDVLSGAKGAVDGFTSGAKSAVGGLKNLTSAMMSGMLFEDNSGHNASTTNHTTSTSNTKKISKSNPNGSSSSNHDIKTAFNGINAALGLKKAVGSNTNSSSSTNK